MFLTSIKISGFRSFYHKIILEDLCPGINVILGPNGSGKTNFLQAIKFIFNEFSNKNFYENNLVGINLTVAKHKIFFSIQITFNNSSRLFPMDNNFLVFQRTIGSNFDRVWINSKYFSPRQFFSFLDSLGFIPQTFLFGIGHRDQFFLKEMNCFVRFKFIKNIIGFGVFFKIKKKILSCLKRVIGLKSKINRSINLLFQKLKVVYNEIKRNKIKIKINNVFFLLRNYVFSLARRKVDQLLTSIKKQKQKIFLIERQITNSIFSILFKINFLKRLIYFRLNKKNKIFFKQKAIKFLRLAKKLGLVKKLEYLFTNYVFFSHEKHWRENKLKWINLSLYFCNNIWKWKKKAIIEKKTNIFKYKLPEDIFENFWTNIGTWDHKFIFFKNNIFKITYCLNKKKNSWFTLRKFIYYKKKILDYYKNEIFTEKNFIEKSLIQSESFLKKYLGGKVVSGIYIITKLINQNENLKKNTYGLLFDLISIHRYFVLPVEIIFREIASNIIVKNKKTAIIIMNKLKTYNQIKGCFIFLENLKQERIKKFYNYEIIPIFFTIHSKLMFQTLIKNLCVDTYVTNQSRILDKISKDKKIKIVTLSGEIFYPDGFYSKKARFEKDSFYLRASSMKKDRILFNWLKKIEILNNILKNKISYISLKTLNYFLILAKIQKNDMNKNKRKKIEYREFMSVNPTTNSELYYLLYLGHRTQEKKKAKLFIKNSYKINYHIRFKTDFIAFFLKKIFILSSKIKIIKLLYLQSVLDHGKKGDKLSTLTRSSLDSEEEKRFDSILQATTYVRLISIFKKNLINFTITFEKIRHINKNFLKSLVKLKNTNVFFDLKECFWKKATHWFHLSKKKFLKFLDRINIKKKKHLRKVLSETPLNFNKLQLRKLDELSQETNQDLGILKQTLIILIEKNRKFLFKAVRILSLQFFFIFEFLFNMKGRLIFFYSFLKNKIINEKNSKKKKVGVNIIAQFDKKYNNTLLEQMSNGQLTIVSLILFISVSKISTMSTYIFDEFDANLDTYFKKKAIFLLKKLSSMGYQIILVSFSYESILGADKWIGTWFTGKGTKIKFIEKKKALEFLTY